MAGFWRAWEGAKLGTIKIDCLANIFWSEFITLMVATRLGKGFGEVWGFMPTCMSSKMDQNQLRALATVKKTEKHLIFVSERDRVFSVKPNARKGETKTKYNKVNAKHLKFS